jgi:acetyl-CoA carboxylase biotin carboxyl carrier protein
MIAMGRYGIKKLSLKKDDTEIVLEREERWSGKVLDVGSEDEVNPLRQDFERRRAQGFVGREYEEKDAPGVEPSTKEEEGVFITSPMVGTFYQAPSPKDPSFVKVGDKVDENTIVCVIEAMKVLNEVKAGIRGVVAEVLIENAHPVEFGSRLFRITQSS